jgi:predicted Ser/Thr protein kinase
MPGKRSEPLRSEDPRRLGSYELVGRLGEGGMGTVYLARTPGGTLVAIKVVRADLAPDDEFRRRFRSEVNRVRQVPPFCTAEVLDADPDHEHPYLVVEYVDGPTLAEVVEERGPLTASNLHGVAIGVATALTAIHGAGVIHRDLKPRNVLLAPGSPKVIDFGIARALEATSRHTGVGQMVGTVAYMAPERFGDADAPVTPAADVFAWGGVVAYAGTGRTPFGNDSMPATAGRILTQPPNLHGLSGSLHDLVASALQKDPADRPTARELLDLLVAGPSRPAATAAALAGQPGLRAAARQAQSVTGLMPAGPVSPAGTVVEAEPAMLAGPEDDTVITRPAAGAPVPPAPGRGRWFAPVAVGLLLLAVLAGAGMVMWAKGPGGRSAGAGPVPSASASVSAAVSPSASVPVPIRIADDLVRARLWEAKAEPDGKRCSFDGALVAQIKKRGLYKCKGPRDLLPLDLRASVGVRLLTKDTCAAIWFRFRNTSGYQLQICPQHMYVATHKNTDVEVLRTIPLDDPIKVGAPAVRIGLRTADNVVHVTLDDKPVASVSLTDPEIAGDRLVLGVYTDVNAPETGNFAVAFDHIEIEG